MTSYIAIVPPANLVHSIYDFYVEQQTWVSSQLQNSGSPSAANQPLALSPAPLPSRNLVERRTNTQRRRRRSAKSHRHINLDLRTRLTYLPRQSPIHSRHLRRNRRRDLSHKQHPQLRHLRRRTSSSTRTASPPATPQRETLSPTPVPTTAGMALLAMYGDMVKDRMQSCMRLEEMVRDARSKDLFAVSLF